MKLDDYLLLLSGQDFPPQKYNSEHKGIPYIIGASNIENEKLFVNRWTEEPSVISILNDVLVVCKGAGVGKIAMNNVGDVHIARQIQAIRDETDIINSKFIKLCIASNISGIIANANGLIPGLKRELLLSLIIPVAPIEEQSRIVTAVEQWFTLIDSLEKETDDLSAKIRQIKSTILDLAIHGKLVPQDPNDEPAIELLKRINPSFVPCDNAHDANQLPDSWCCTSLGNVGKWQSGATPSRLNKEYYGGDIPWLKTGDLNDGYIYEIPETITQKALEETSVKLNPAGSVLIAMYGATIGKVGILTCPATTNQACCACVDYQGIDQMYLFYFLLSHREEFIMLGGGGAQPNISKEKIVETLFPLPPYKEQLRIVAKIEELFAALDEIQKSIEV